LTAPGARPGRPSGADTRAAPGHGILTRSVTQPATRSPSPNPSPRADPEGRRRGRRTALFAALAAIAVAIVVGGLVAAGVFGNGSDGGRSAGGGAPAPPKAQTTVSLSAGTTSVEAPLLFTKFPEGAGEQVVGLLTRYVDDGIVAALRTGKADDADLSNALDTGVATQLAGTDRSVLFDEGLPRATGKVTVTAPPVPITALVGADGNAVILVADVQLDVTAATKRGPVHITRSGDVEFAPDASGAWKVTGYDLTVNRDGRGVPVAAAGTSTTGTAGK
jgi:hypothetical protein